MREKGCPRSYSPLLLLPLHTCRLSLCLLDMMPIKNEMGEVVLFLFLQGHHSEQRPKDLAPQEAMAIVIMVTSSLQLWGDGVNGQKPLPKGTQALSYSAS